MRSRCVPIQVVLVLAVAGLTLACESNSSEDASSGYSWSPSGGGSSAHPSDDDVKTGQATTLSGRVIDGAHGTPIAGALVGTSPASASMSTNNEGLFVIQTNLTAGLTYRVSASKSGYAPSSVDVTINPGANQIADLVLQAGQEDTSCFPMCRSGFACVGGSCTTACNPPCGLGEMCKDGTCVKDCTPSCGTRQCGPDPECGEPCGSCAPNETCTDAGKCLCEGAECGADCCATGEQCVGGACCAPDCGGLSCGNDGACGVSCGSCPTGKKCEDGACLDIPCDADCTGRSCGPDPVCGQSCGSCSTDSSCDGTGQCTCSFSECGGIGVPSSGVRVRPRSTCV